MHLGKNMPSLQETVFGWIFTGTIHLPKTTKHKNSVLYVQSKSEISNAELNKTLTKFWELEEIPEQTFVSPEQ